jgi:pyruvate dehydrogenase E2 component (dihydrolipoamide acetyltransferase)
MPDLGATGGDVMFIEWLVKPGDQVRVGQPLFLVETDKATVEVEAFRDGVVRELFVEAGDSVSLGSTVAIVADSLEEQLPVHPSEVSSGEGPPGGSLPTEYEPVPASMPDSRHEIDNGRILVSPIARRMAESEGINLSMIKGTGRQNQILKRDVENALSSSNSTSNFEAGVRREPISPMRRAIAQRTHHSKQVIPHYYADITVDMSAALALYKEAGKKAKRRDWVSPTITDVCLLATAMTLGNCPELNASFQEKEILYYAEINIGLVVGLATGGMLVPVVRNADGLNLFKLAAITRRLREKAEKGILSESEMNGGTFSLSNLGMYGLDSFTAVINPPQAGILALGAVREMPAVHEGNIVPRPMMKATLSADHRLVDGIIAAQFLADWRELLETPSTFTLEPPQEHSR